MYKGTKPSTNKLAQTSRITASNLNNSNKKKSATVSKDKTNNVKFSSFNSLVRATNNQSTDLNNSRKMSNNLNSTSDLLVGGFANNLNSNISHKKYTNTFSSQMQDKLNKSRNSHKEDSLNMSKRLPTNTSVNNLNPSTPNDKYSNFNSNISNRNNLQGSANKNNSMHAQVNFPKPPADFAAGNNTNAKKNISSGINLNLNMNNMTNFSGLVNTNNINNGNKNSLGDSAIKMQPNSYRDSSENTNNVSDLKNRTNLQNNFTFNNNNNNWVNSNMNNNTNPNTNGNIMTGPGNNTNNFNNNNSNNIGTNQNQIFSDDNIYVNSKNSKKADNDRERNLNVNNKYSNNTINDINLANKANGNISKNKLDNTNKFANDIAKSKGKNNIYDIFKGQTNKKPTTTTTAETKVNSSKISSIKNNNNYNNTSLSSSIMTNINKNNNQETNFNNNNNNLLNSIEIKRIPNDKETSLQNLNLNNSQNLNENLNLKNSKILNSSSQINVGTSNNFDSSPIRPIKRDINSLGNLNGSIGFSSIELKSPNNNEKDSGKSVEKTTGVFNKYRNDNKANNKKNFGDLYSNNKNEGFNIQNNNNNIVNNNNVDNDPQEDDFNFNYNDEKIYSENQESSRKEVIEYDLDNFENEKINSNDALSTNNLNKFNHNRGKSNTYLTNEPLTSIEELDEKVLLQNTEENVKSSKENFVNSNASKKDNQTLNKINLFNNITNKKDEKSLENFNRSNSKDEREKNNKSSFNSYSNFNSSPSRKTYKNEVDQIDIKNNPESKRNQKGFDYKEDINNKNKNQQELVSIQNMTNNISPINNDGEIMLKKKNSDDLNLTPIVQLKDKDIYKKGTFQSRKSNDMFDLMVLKNLIDSKPDGTNSTTNININNPNSKNEKPIETPKIQKLPTIDKDKNNNSVTQNNFNNKKIETKNSSNSLNNTKTVVKKETSSPSKPIEKATSSLGKSVNKLTTQIKKTGSNNINTSTLKSNKDNNSSSQNKDKPSFFDDLDSKNNSKIMNTTQSRNLKTGGNELNSSKTFNKLLSPKELVKNVISAAKSIGKNKKTLIENKNPFVAGRNSIRKSVSINPKDKSLLKFGLNKTGLGNTNNTMNSTLTEGKKRNNFISKSKMKTSKANQSDVQSNKISRQSILGKIMSTRNIKGDDRTKNILTEIDRSFEVTATQANQKRSLNPFNSLLRMSMGSFRDSYDFDFDRKFSGSLRSDDYNPLKRRNTKSFPDKFFKGNLYKKNSMMYSPEREIEDTLNKSNNTITGSGPCENLKVRLNENHVISRIKCLPKSKKFAKYNKGKYELVESYDENFGWKRSYHPRELYVSISEFVSLNEKDEAKEILIKPANLRKDQKDEMNQKQFEKLQGNFIDESISKITKMNRLERMRANRHSSISASPTRTLNNFCFSPMAANAASKKGENIGGIGSTELFSDRTIRNTSINDESLNYQSKNFTTINNNPNNVSVIKAEKKIGNTKVLILENNFVICNADEDKVFSPFENSILDNNYLNTINANAPNTSGFIGGIGHVEVTSQNNQKLEKIERLEKISSTVLNLNKKNINQGKPKNSFINEKNNYNTLDVNINYRKNKNNDSSLVESSSAFTIGHLNNLKIENLNNESNLNVIKNSSINTRRNKRNKILEAQNVINLFYQMHPEKNKYGYYSFAYNDEDYSSNAFTILKSSENNSNNAFQVMNTISHVINVKNPVKDNNNAKKISNLASNLRNNLNKLEINNNIYQYENNLNNPSQSTKNFDKPSVSNLKKITFNLKDENNKLQENSNNFREILSQPNSNLRNNTDANNEKNLNENILREAYKSGNFNVNNLAAIANNKDPALNKILLEDNKNSFADNIRKNKESLNDPDFFDKVKNFLDVKRVKTQVIEKALLNPNSNTNKNTKNRISYGNFDNISQYVEKNINDNMNKLKSMQIGTSYKNDANDVNGKVKSYDSENLVIASSSLKNNPLSNRNFETNININSNFNTIDGNNYNNNLNSNKTNQKELITKKQIPENSKNLREASNRINEIDNMNNLDQNLFVLPMNSRAKATIQGSPDKSEKNTINDANIELVSEKIKKEKHIETLNQKFYEKLTTIKNTKNIKNYFGNNVNRVIDDFHDYEFENFKNEFKINNNQNEYILKDAKDIKENLNSLNNLKDDKMDNKKNKKKEGNNILISDEQLSEFKDKYLGKIEFLDKDKANLFYRKYLKGVNNNNANKFKNFFLSNKEDKITQISEADKKEKELGMRLVNLKNMLNIDDPKKSKEQKDLNALNFLYEKAERKNQADIALNNISSSNLGNLLNLNESKINNVNYNSSGSNSNNNTLKLLGNLSSLKFGSTLGNSVGNNNNNNIHAFGNTGNNTNRENSMTKQVLNKNQMNVPSPVYIGRNNTVKDLKFSF